MLEEKGAIKRIRTTKNGYREIKEPISFKEQKIVSLLMRRFETNFETIHGESTVIKSESKMITGQGIVSIIWISLVIRRTTNMTSQNY